MKFFISIASATVISCPATLTIVEALERTIALLMTRLRSIKASTRCRDALACAACSSLDLKPVGTLPTSTTAIKVLLSKATLAELIRFSNSVNSARASVTVMVVIFPSSPLSKKTSSIATSRWRDLNSQEGFTRASCCQLHHTCIIKEQTAGIEPTSRTYHALVLPVTPHLHRSRRRESNSHQKITKLLC